MKRKTRWTVLLPVVNSLGFSTCIDQEGEKYPLFHAEAFKLMGIQPVFSPERLKWITEKETAMNRRFPQSFRELYATENVEEWFASRNWDQMVPLQQLELETRKYWECELGLRFLNVPPHMQAHEGIHFFTECQGCWSWWILLNGAEDPPVIVESLFDEAQILACDKLSDFIFACAWDHSIMDSPFFQSGCYTSEKEFLVFLRNRCVEKPTTRLTSTEHRYRFECKNGRLFLFEETGQIFFAAENEESKNEWMTILKPFVAWDP